MCSNEEDLPAAERKIAEKLLENTETLVENAEQPVQNPVLATFGTGIEQVVKKGDQQLKKSNYPYDHGGVRIE